MKKEDLKVPFTFKAYKVFNLDWKCRDMQFEVGKEYKEDKISICNYGIHACLNLSDCFNYYSFDCNNKVAEVTILGNFEMHDDDTKVVTDHIKIEKELSWEEVLRLCNSGNGNSGNRNSGDVNSGNLNSGNRNSGNQNSGNQNSGHQNSGDQNSGDQNSGYRNSGNRNSGNRNSGNLNSGNLNSGHLNSGDVNSGKQNSGDQNSGKQNSGDQNSGHRNSGNGNSGDQNSGHRNSGNGNSGHQNSGHQNSGIFNTDEPKLRMFNNNSEMFYRDWYNTAAYDIINRMSLTSFIGHDVMTEQEMKDHPEYQTIGGYLKTNEYKVAWKIWFESLSKKEIKIIKEIPNFDSQIFEEITGLKI